MWLSFFAALAGLTLESTPAQAGAARPEEAVVEAVSVRLEIHRGGERTGDGSRAPRTGAVVEASAEYRLTRPAASGEEVVLLDFARALAKDPVELDEVAVAGHVEGPFSPARTEAVGEAGVARLERRGPRGDIVVVPAAGRRSFVIRYRVTVPRRDWPLGCSRRRCSLSGAIAPLPSAVARGGRNLPADGRVIAPVHWRVASIRFAADASWVPGTIKTEAQRRTLGDDDILVATPDVPAAHPSVFWGPAWHVERFVRRGVAVEIHHPYRRPGGRVPDETRIQLRRDVPGRVARVVEEAIEVLDRARMPVAPDARLVVVQGPLRSSVAASHPDVVMVSDQAFQLFPADRFLKFHEVVIARAVFDALVQRRFAGRHDPSTDLWLAGAVAFALTQAWQVERELRDEFAGDILRRFTFVPAVDRFLYTGQAAFSPAYFRGSEDDLGVRNHPEWFSHRLPTGRRIHEKLADLMTVAELERFYAEVAGDPGVDPRAAAERAWGRELDWFFDLWLGEYPSVEYEVAAVESEPRPRGGFRHRIRVGKRGREPVIEPVQLLAVERGGRRHYLVWNGELGGDGDLGREPVRGEHEFVLETDRKLAVVWLDPRVRLREDPQPPHDNVDPLFDNRVPPAPRFLYTGAGLDVAASEFLRAKNAAARLASISGFVSFEGSLRRDLRRTGHLLLLHTREANLAASGGLDLWFGDKRNRQRRAGIVRMFVGTDWLNASRLDPKGGVRTWQSFGLAHDNRRFVWWPERGHVFGWTTTFHQTLRTDGSTDHRFDAVMSASWSQLVPIAHDHVLATSLSSTIVLPIASRPEFRTLARLGGIGGMSGYLADEIFGLANALAQVEYRHVYVNNLPVNLVHLAWLRSLGGVLFAGSGTTSHCLDYGGWFSRSSFYHEVGYGLMAYMQILGVSPQLLRLDVSVPLVRRTHVECLGRELPAYLAELQGLRDASALLRAYTVNLTFVQPF